MALTKTDQWMLPGWAMESKRSKRLMEWILDEIPEGTLEAGDGALFKVRCRSFLFLYYGKREGKAPFPKIGESLTYNGFCHLADYQLYDAGPDLLSWLGKTDGHSFPTREELRQEAEAAISKKARMFIREEWHALLKAYTGDKKDLLPRVDREKVLRQAGELYREGKRPEDLEFSPAFSFGRSARYFPYCLFYLEDKKRASASIAREWAMQNFALFSRQKIWMGCVKDELAQLHQQAAKRNG